ncbi:HAMP domain-containing protein [Flexivirga sp. ID2601S]|uniref:histidine kinase n=1 Tax=Flexivirga aerilata TaxID=1656889 RepID=A0A849AHK9_9MICO|nr:HAMP domain-containing sensor histidine kinase [Flexivirga aerilata]NNG38678.1 HAMP domain-containing protein [Flexivirga aerilata]
MSASLHPSRWTLRTKLVAWMLLLFLAVTFAVGALTVWQLNRTLRGQVDNQLYQSARVFDGPGGRLTIGGPPPVAGQSIRVTLDRSTGTVARLVVKPAGFSTDFTVESDNTVYSYRTIDHLSDTQVALLQAAGIGRNPTSIDLGGSLGEYRVIAVQSEAAVATANNGVAAKPVTTIIGLPTGPNRTTVAKTAVAVALLSGAGVILVGLAAAYIIRRNLEPLRRVAATATRVSRLPLSTGAVVMTERVADRDTDEGTEVGQVGAAFNGMLDHIDHALTARHESEQRVRQFVADASHELRTPLASIRGYAELSRRETEPVPTGVTHALGRIESESDRMTALVEDLLLLARLDSGRPLDRDQVDLSLIAIETVSDAQAAGPGHLWSLDLPEDPVEVEGDASRIRQVVINLLANARRHTPEGTRVVLSLRPDGDGVLLQVRDNGPGIPAALVPRIFERFTRGDSARSRSEGSTGLGLSIVHAVVTAHHGRVRVESVPGDTVFSIWLPHRQPGAAR